MDESAKPTTVLSLAVLPKETTFYKMSVHPATAERVPLDQFSAVAERALSAAPTRWELWAVGRLWPGWRLAGEVDHRDVEMYYLVFYLDLPQRVTIG